MEAWASEWMVSHVIRRIFYSAQSNTLTGMASERNGRAVEDMKLCYADCGGLWFGTDYYGKWWWYRYNYLPIPDKRIEYYDSRT